METEATNVDEYCLILLMVVLCILKQVYGWNVSMIKTVLLVSYFAPPIINAESILVWKTLRELSSHFEIKVLTSKFLVNSRVDPQMAVPQGIKVYRKPMYKPTSPLLKKLTDKAIGLVLDEEYLWASFGQLKSLDCDLIYSRSHPGSSHILAHRIKQRTKKPWIAQFSDPWTGNPYHTNHTRFRKASDTHWEQKVIHDADFLVFPTEEILDIYKRTYKSFNIGQKSIVLPHHYIPNLYSQETRQDSYTPSTISFAYFGDFYGLRSPVPFVEALRNIADTTPSLLNNVTIDFYGNIESKFFDIVEESPLKIGSHKVTYFESLNLMTKKDVLLLIDAPSNNGVNPFLASKLVDYLGAGRRILGITAEKGTSANILRKYGHHVVSPNDTQGIINAIKECITSPKDCFVPPVEFTSKNVIDQLVDVMRRVPNQFK